jgi:hypothetical protein
MDKALDFYPSFYRQGLVALRVRRLCSHPSPTVPPRCLHHTLRSVPHPSAGTSSGHVGEMSDRPGLRNADTSQPTRSHPAPPSTRARCSGPEPRLHAAQTTHPSATVWEEGGG